MLHKINDIFSQFLESLYKEIFWVTDNEFKDQFSEFKMVEPIWRTSLTKSVRISSKLGI